MSNTVVVIKAKKELLNFIRAKFTEDDFERYYEQQNLKDDEDTLFDEHENEYEDEYEDEFVESFVKRLEDSYESQYSYENMMNAAKQILDQKSPEHPKDSYEKQYTYEKLMDLNKQALDQKSPEEIEQLISLKKLILSFGGLRMMDKEDSIEWKSSGFFFNFTGQLVIFHER